MMKSLSNGKQGLRLPQNFNYRLEQNILAGKSGTGILLGLILCLLPFVTCLGQGTFFTYQGRLNDGNNLASGSYDLRFTIYDSTNAPGVVIAGPLTLSATSVSNGLFTVSLDFGPGVFTGLERWLEIGVRSNGIGSFVALEPRQKLAPTPYAMYAAGANASGITGTLPSASLSGTYSNPITFNNGADSFSGTFYGQFYGLTFVGGSFSGAFIGDGAGLANVNAATFGGVTGSQIWKTVGNGGTAATNFLGTTDSQPLELRVNNRTAYRLLPSFGIPNVIGGSLSNAAGASVEAATIAGGGLDLFPNRVQNNYASIGGGTFNTAAGAWSTIAGGRDNNAFADHSTVGGGRANLVQSNADYSVINGGFGNVVASNATFSVINGGLQNLIASNADYATIGGGDFNQIRTNATYATVGGGFFNLILDESVGSTIAGGNNNGIRHDSPYATIGGGIINFIFANATNSTIAGGFGNLIQTNAQGSTISGGSNNQVRSNGLYSTISGGINNTVQENSLGSVIGGGYQNVVRTNSSGATIPGGYANFATNFAFAAGHQAKANHEGSFVWADSQDFSDFTSTANFQFLIRAAGGVGINTNNPSGAGLNVNGGVVAASFTGNGSALTGISASSLGGGTVGAAVNLSNPGNSFSGNGGGLTNVNAATLGGLSPASFWQLGGNAPGSGQFLGSLTTQPVEFRVNNVRALRLEPAGSTAGVHVIGGSRSNGVVGVSGPSMFPATIAGGGTDISPNIVSEDYATIAGGVGNIAGNTNALFDRTGPTVGGGGFNIASGSYSTIPGGLQNIASGDYSFAAGQSAQATNTSAFVWNDSTGAILTSTNTHSVTMRASGGYRLFSNSGATLGVFLAANGNSWAAISDRDAKKNFQPVDSRAVLEKLAQVPVERWNYKSESDDAVPHLGPMAQDFKEAFYPGRDDKSISTLEFDGVELAAIQGLNQKLETELQQKNERIVELERRLERLEQLVSRHIPRGN